MNDQQLAAVKQALEALRFALHVGFDESSERQIKKGDKAVQQHQQAITALQSIISQDALYKMAEDAVTIGLSYNDWPKIGCVNHDCDQCKAVQSAERGEPVAINEVQELSDSFIENPEAIKYLLDCLYWAQGEEGLPQTHYNFIRAFQRKGYAILQRLNEDYGPEWTFSKHAATPPTPQPVPVKTYHDGKPWPVAPKPWVGLTLEDKQEYLAQDFGGSRTDAMDWAEKRLKEKNT